MTKIVSLMGGPVATDTTADPAIIARLEATLARAKAGEIIGIAIAEVHRNGSTQNGWDGAAPISVLGEATRMTVSLAQSMKGGE